MNNGYGNNILLYYAQSLQSCLTLCDSMDCTPPGSSVQGGFSRQEYWSGLTCPPPGDLPNPEIEPASPPNQKVIAYTSSEQLPHRFFCLDPKCLFEVYAVLWDNWESIQLIAVKLYKLLHRHPFSAFVPILLSHFNVSLEQMDCHSLLY